MGFDTSFHPVDLPYIHGTLIPALLTGDGLAEIEAQAAKRAKVRYLAKAWALGALAASQGAAREAEKAGAAHAGLLSSSAAAKPERAPGLLGRLFGKPAPPREVVPPPVAVPAWTRRLDSDLHVWGRPYFISADQPAEISAAIDTWLAASPEDAESLGRAMALRLAPEFGPVTEPELGSGLPTDEAFGAAVNEPLSACREVLRTLQAGEMFAHPEGGDLDPADLVGGTDFAYLLLRIASWSRPGWMSRGTWPSKALPQVAGASVGWQPATILIAPILELHPRIKPRFEATITANYQVGGLLRAEDVPRLREAIEADRERLLGDSLDENQLQKLRESLLDAETRGLAFVEATEVYSGPEGVMN